MHKRLSCGRLISGTCAADGRLLTFIPRAKGLLRTAAPHALTKRRTVQTAETSCSPGLTGSEAPSINVNKRPALVCLQDTWNRSDHSCYLCTINSSDPLFLIEMRLIKNMSGVHKRHFLLSRFLFQSKCSNHLSFHYYSNIDDSSSLKKYLK